MTTRIQYIFLELPNSLSRALTENATVLDNFCFALHQMEHLTERPAGLKQEIFRLLFDSAEITNFYTRRKSQVPAGHDHRKRHTELYLLCKGRRPERRTCRRSGRRGEEASAENGQGASWNGSLRRYHREEHRAFSRRGSRSPELISHKIYLPTGTTPPGPIPGSGTPSPSISP